MTTRYLFAVNTTQTNAQPEILMFVRWHRKILWPWILSCICADSSTTHKAKHFTLNRVETSDERMIKSTWSSNWRAQQQGTRLICVEVFVTKCRSWHSLSLEAKGLCRALSSIIFSRETLLAGRSASVQRCFLYIYIELCLRVAYNATNALYSKFSALF